MTYTIKGDDLQFIEVTLNPNESFKSQAGAMLYMQSGIDMEAKIFDTNSGGFFSKIGNVLKRVISGEGFALSYFTNISNEPKKVAFSAEVAGKIIPIELNDDEFILQPEAYLCSTPDIEIDIRIPKFTSGAFGGEGFILQKLKGNGIAFVNAGGTIEKIELNNESIKVDTGSLVGFSSGIDYSVEVVKGFKNILFGGEGITLANLSGSGVVYIQSMPFKRFANKIYEELSPHFTKTGGENSFDVFDKKS